MNSGTSSGTTATASPCVAVVGGGYAGMAAATELARNHVPVTVFEAARTLGGRARRVEVGSIALDNGLHILAGAYRETLRLIDLVRRPDEPTGLVRIPLELSMHPHFFLRLPRLPAPLHLAAGLLRARGLDWSARIRAATFMRTMQKRRFRLDADISVAELLATHRQPQSVNRYLWYPLCISALNTPPKQASAQVFLSVLKDCLDGARADSDLLLPAVDFSTLFPERAARYINSRGGHVYLGTTIDGLRRNGTMFSLGPDRKMFSHVILAVSPHRLGTVSCDDPAFAAITRSVEAFSYQPIYSVYLQYARGRRLPFRMGGIEAEYAQWLFDRGQLCGQDGLIGVVISATGAHQDMDQDRLAQAVHRELAQHFPELGDLLWHQVIAEKRATYACTPGMKRPPNRTAIAGLFLAGDYTASEYPATLEAAVRSGVAAANLVMHP